MAATLSLSEIATLMAADEAANEASVAAMFVRRGETIRIHGVVEMRVTARYPHAAGSKVLLDGYDSSGRFVSEVFGSSDFVTTVAKR